MRIKINIDKLPTITPEAIERARASVRQQIEAEYERLSSGPVPMSGLKRSLLETERVRIAERFIPQIVWQMPYGEFPWPREMPLRRMPTPS